MKRLIIPILLFVPLYAMALSLTDDFDDNSLDGAKWTEYENNCTNSETNQQIEQQFTGAAPGNECDTYSSNSYNWDEVSMDINLVQLAAPGVDSSFWFHDTHGDRAMRLCNSGTCYVYVQDSYGNGPCGGSNCGSQAITPGADAYLRIREESGTTYWDYSTDGRDTWNNTYSTTTANIPWAVSSVKVYLQAYKYNTTAFSEDTTIWDSFNLPYPSTDEPGVTLDATSITLKNTNLIVE